MMDDEDPDRDAADSDREGDARLGYLLRRAAGAHRLRLDRALAGLDVTPPQFFALTLLAAHPGESSAGLARMAALKTSTVSVIVANLDRRGAIARRPHAVHGRVQHLDLTELGWALLAACRARAVAVERELAHGLGPGQVETLRDWLAGVARGDAPPGAA